MLRNLHSQRYNADLILQNEQFDAEFCRLFWNPFGDATVQQPVKITFKRKRARKRHGATSTNAKHRCSDCDAVFRWPSDLNYHHAYQHSGEQLNVCPEASCALNFQFPYQLTKHQRTSGHHNWQVICQQCNKRFGSQRFLGRHTVASCNRYKLKCQKGVQ
ncbi:zinc finger protein 729-like [Anopheles maculipalpis]|uniref:zinc finger protein 729-like n=1 Tax=Anopheles maculipalpis TaxID=1496333 RepID=UPI002158E510|nr:zinc finger protein 729-like [Anopheles maculipalpis]